ncbi:8641_t:CDS:2 [Funneliformis geosporum]|uniref:14144_t:CDS:1 n=1 Tax=Funneliformis geosporum TaxID=1117311 RepID=A0A9W4SEG6_9GLOM|nr:14144_t:CDS:2 [Funneliformis geosporum]CAI2165722.1 8641_t:CDS:2 [Funneliformis geosporum]
MAKFSHISVLIAMIVFALQPANVNAGPIAYAVCQTACNVGWVSCYASAGLVAGTVTGGLGAPFAAIACNVAQGVCMAACVGLLTAPTP